MSPRGTLQRQIAVFAAALLMSTIAIGSAVGPGATSLARPIVDVTYA